MILSKTTEPVHKDFITLMDETIKVLSKESLKEPERYLTYLGNKLEGIVTEIMEEKAKGTIFENTIELVSGQRFPDIIARKYFGVEVKSTKQNHWTTTGNSVLESTRVSGIEKIFMLFGKMSQPIEFIYRPYEECLSDVVVTHSPRYLINMKLEENDTIFDRLKIPYDELRLKKNPIKPITEYYKKLLRPGEEVWWLDQEENSSSSFIIRLWNNISIEDRNEIIAMGMILFPELFGSNSNKYNRFSIWLATRKGIVCPNIRDNFTSGGKGTVLVDNTAIDNIPRAYINLVENLEKIIALFEQIDKKELKFYWNIKSLKLNAKEYWINQVCDHSKNILKETNLNLKELLKDRLLLL